MATMEDVRAEFSRGLNVLTGETGAGKSVLLGAIAFATGAKASKAAIREGAKEARVEAEFEVSGEALRRVAAVLDEAGLPPCDEPGRVCVRRTLSAAGGGRVWINDSPSTLATLGRLCAGMVDMHGTGANGMLGDAAFRHRAIDGCGGIDAGPYRAAWDGLQKAESELASLEGETSAEDEADLLRYQIGELEEAGPSADDDDLAERQATAARAGETVRRALAVTEAIGGDGGASDILGSLASDFAFLAKTEPDAAKWADSVSEAIVSLQEVSRSAADLAARMEAAGADLEELDARLSLVEKLKRKYLDRRTGPDRPASGGAGSRLAMLLEEKRGRLAALEGREETIARLRREVETAKDAVKREGEKLAAKRAAASAEFSAAVVRELRDLGFDKADFRARPVPCEPGPDGCDEIRCMFAPNPGEGERELSETASSGETARVMLAVKKILAAHDGAQTVVFDEIDANVGGETGRAVGAKLKAVAKGRQVIAVTHLPQTAAFAGTHLVAKKKTERGRTRTSIASADGELRIEELARMLGGGPAAVKHARAMLASRRQDTI